MSRIIYGVAGQGFGHSTRAKEIIRYLIGQGHEVLVFTYGQALFFLSEEFPTVEVPGLILCYTDNVLDYGQTVYKNALQLIQQTKNWKSIKAKFKEFNPDLVITDFEPLTAILAKVGKKPLLSIDNQHQLTNTKIDITDKYKKDLLADKLIIKTLVWGAKHYLITTFFQTPITKKNTSIFPPILRQEILDLRPAKGDYFLVYQNSDFGHLIPVLKQTGQKFVIFGMNVDQTDGNLTFKNYSNHEWLKYLENCRAVIGTAGLSLMCEALHLKKPYLAIPVKRQIEQIINAQYLQKKAYGIFTYQFTLDDFNQFAADLPVYENNLEAYNRQDNSAIFKKLAQLIKELA